jgi:hypothetical protein
MLDMRVKHHHSNYTKCLAVFVSMQPIRSVCVDCGRIVNAYFLLERKMQRWMGLSIFIREFKFCLGSGSKIEFIHETP